MGGKKGVESEPAGGVVREVGVELVREVVVEVEDGTVESRGVVTTLGVWLITEA